jgi:hypothetical protein
VPPSNSHGRTVGLPHTAKPAGNARAIHRDYADS